MKILSVAYPLLPVGADASGGSEQILYYIDRALVEAGHDSIVIAQAGSQLSGRLIATRPPEGEVTDAVMQGLRAAHRNAVESVLASESVDCIHFHGLDFAEYVRERNVRQIATVHLPADWYPAGAFERHHLELVCVSRSQALGFPKSAVVIPNGVDGQKLQRPPRRRDTLLWLGRVCPEKGVHLALEAAHRANRPLVVAGPVHPFRFHYDYFDREVKPLLDDRRTYVGAVGLDGKADLLARAQALLVPSLAQETSSLVAMEALAAGVPVIAFRSGALPEVVEHGRTGWIVDSISQMADAIGHVNDIREEDCREAARTRFSVRRMTAEYLTLYERRAINLDRG